MKEITIKDFKGQNFKEGLWDQSYAFYTTAMDFYGLGDDQTKNSFAGVLQGSMSLSAMAQAAATNNITAVITGFSYYSTDNAVYGIDTNNAGRIYRLTGGSTWTYVSAINVSGIGADLAQYGANLYYATNNYLGVYNGTAGNANFQQFSSANTLPRVLKVFAGSLFASNGRYVDKYDGTTYSSQKLALPSDFIVRSMEIYRDALYISADNGNYSRIFVWDGTSPTYNDQMPLYNEQFAPSLVVSQGLLWIVGNRGTLTNVTTFLTPIYVYEYQVPELIFNLPLKRDTTYTPITGVAAYQNGILVGSCDSTTGMENGVGGAWFIGKDIATGKFHASLMFVKGFNVTVGAIYSTGRTQAGSVSPAMYMAIDDSTSGHSYGVVQAASSSVSPNAYFTPTWMSLPMDAGSTNDKSWTAIKFNFDSLATGTSVIVKYRLNNDTAWTSLKTFLSTDPSTDKTMRIPIGRTSRTIAIQIAFGVTASCATPRLHSFTLFYEPTGN